MVKDSIRIERLESVESTSTWLRTYRADAPNGTVVVTDCQTAGRGQRGNSWEAEPGKNLTFSILTRPQPSVPAAEQYALSEAVATAIVDTLDNLVPDSSLLEIKWPNDIYYG
ncbi:MAG: biotin--[acetyl-CoA-carboxylase] ligase, partial [Muribaculaceae bacterium]|nr:biotin--[acetyl-CoA-carboxylase] ligase [Muribaculaceae bacterium]